MAPQQERARRTRAALVSAAAAEFSDHGYAAASLSAILRRSGATKGAMYFHFESKQELAKAVLETAADRLLEVSARLIAAPDGRVVETLYGLADEIAQLYQEDDVLRAEFRLALESDLLADVGLFPCRMWQSVANDLAEQAQREGLMRPGFRPEGFARMLLALFIGQRYLCDHESDVAGLRENFVDSLETLLRAYADENWLDEHLESRKIMA
ncbi:TetR/AcrR family transcriptional regulator [Rhodococcus sp. D2-41]|uniref:TetR/AcrR family transcriptional regulator n=1 Tax=Speluncibacter jeojiensis TaxID=2710754 RepID=A0A9X4LZE7_9ACTN|nr:ScbR family autoregulator-binding transcription factor [Rhodococcus sp. D2-41]MDG3011620.1 TetR/AcrR family transcriptional regulator [Rhodococcus sp. D2-41]MDG3015024.1 TetR/AcrR family transcriptional regulator [Corynebacteriales bacterium D3-21]